MKQVNENKSRSDAVSFVCVKGTSVPSEIDSSLFHEIALFPIGDVELITESVHIYLKPNTMVMIPKGTYHKFIVHGNKERNYWYCLLFDDIPELQSVFAQSICGIKALKTNVRVHCLFQILQELPPDAESKEILLRSVLMLLLNEISQSKAAEYSLQDQNEVVQQAVNYVKENIVEKLTISDVAKECRTSESTLAHIFKREMNQSLYQYIIQVRLTTARQKIYEGVPAKIAAYTCGFNDYSAFYRQYKKFFGFAPTQKRAVEKETLAQKNDALVVNCPAEVGETITFLSLSTPTQGEKGLTYYYTVDGVNLTPFTKWEENAGNSGRGWWTNDDGMNLDIYRSVDDPDNESNFLVAFTADVGSIVIGYEAQCDATLHLNTWTSAYNSDFTVTVAKGELSNVQGIYTVESQNVGTETFTMKTKTGEFIYIKYTPIEPTGDEHFGFMNSLTYSQADTPDETQQPAQ